MSVEIIVSDCMDALRNLDAESVDCVVTSPPYWGLRDYGVAGQIGLEPTLAEHLSAMVAVFEEVKRVLKPDGTCWVNYGDCYANNASTSKIARNDQGNGSGVFHIPPEKHHKARRQEPNRLTAMKADGLKHKDLCMVPNRFAIAMQEAGWWVRSEIIWAKPNPMPESIKDRPATSHEKIWLFTKAPRYFYDADAVRQSRVQDEDANGFRGGSYVGGQPGKRTTAGNVRRTDEQQANGRNLRNYEPAAFEVWPIATRPFSEAHFATFPPELAKRCIEAGCPPGGTVLDPFGGAGTTGLVADRLQRNAILIELNPEYAEIARKRIAKDRPAMLDLMEPS